MLYLINGHQTDVTIVGLLRYARQQRGGYNFMDNHDCAMAQYLKAATGVPKIWVGGYNFQIPEEPKAYEIPRDLIDVIGSRPDNWEALTMRLLDALLKSLPNPST